MLTGQLLVDSGELFVPSFSPVLCLSGSILNDRRAGETDLSSLRSRFIHATKQQGWFDLHIEKKTKDERKTKM